MTHIVPQPCRCWPMTAVLWAGTTSTLHVSVNTTAILPARTVPSTAPANWPPARQLSQLIIKPKIIATEMLQKTYVMLLEAAPASSATLSTTPLVVVIVYSTNG